MTSSDRSIVFWSLSGISFRSFQRQRDHNPGFWLRKILSDICHVLLSQRTEGFDVNIIGLDLKEDVIRHCSELARSYGYDKLHFYQGDIAGYEGVSSVDMVVTLHACDTATDFALAKAVEWGAQVILSVPCCQHELNRQIRNEMLQPVMRYGILKERMAALITDGLRAELLESKRI